MRPASTEGTWKQPVCDMSVGGFLAAAAAAEVDEFAVSSLFHMRVVATRQCCATRFPTHHGPALTWLLPPAARRSFSVQISLQVR